MMNFKEGEVLYFAKPLTWTSFALVNKIRYHLCRKMGVKKLKVGHAGTLDPLATGVIVLCTGKATKRIEELQYGVKEYIATLQKEAFAAAAISAERVALKLADIAFAEKKDDVYVVTAQLKALDLLQKQMGLQSCD